MKIRYSNYLSITERAFYLAAGLVTVEYVERERCPNKHVYTLTLLARAAIQHGWRMAKWSRIPLRLMR
jgi:hypothetical protein